MLRRIALTATVLGFFGLAAFPQDKKLGDDYAKAALLAVKAIRSSEAAAGVSADAAGVKDKIDRADVEATTPEERTNSKALGRLSVEHALNVAMLQALFDGDFRRFSENRTVIAINKAETDCFDAYEEALRARTIDVPKTCDSILPPGKSKKK